VVRAARLHTASKLRRQQDDQPSNTRRTASRRLRALCQSGVAAARGRDARRARCRSGQFPLPRTTQATQRSAATLGAPAKARPAGRVRATMLLLTCGCLRACALHTSVRREDSPHALGATGVCLLMPIR
jgi:hypothetical protein